MEAPLWTPSKKQLDQAQMTRFLHYVNQHFQKDFRSYDDLQQWSVKDTSQFWHALVDFLSIRFKTSATQVLKPGRTFKEDVWFEDAALNFAEHFLNKLDGDIAVINIKENGERHSISYAELTKRTHKMAHQLQRLGVKKGDVVAGILPNCAHTVISMLATSLIGGIWTCCSPDFGEQGIIERFEQVSPKILICTDGYHYNHKQFTTLTKMAVVQSHITSLCHTIVVPYLDNDNVTLNANISHWDTLMSIPACEVEAVPVRFNDPLYILYSSGTTGKPKCIVHGTGGTLLQHQKELALHCDLKEGDVLFYYTTCGWMMWNWMVSALSLGVSIVLYDGSPAVPNMNRLFDICESESVTAFGTSAKFLDAIEKEGVQPMETHNLAPLRCILSTGSPLSSHSFDFVYKSIKADCLLASISGGTDIISCFALGCPIKPVYKNQLQCIGLGMHVTIFDDDGNALHDQKGELVCLSSFPSMPIYFFNDENGQKYQQAYFNKFDGVWAHGDFAKLTPQGGLVIYGRSDAVLNPGGVRIGTAEIYRQVETIPSVVDSVVIGQSWQGDVRVVLFVQLQLGLELDDDLITTIKSTIRHGATPRHVPKIILQVSGIPRTLSGKVVELAVKKTVEKLPITNLEAIANPEVLAEYQNRPELR